MIYRHTATILIAYLIDLMIGDPQGWPHPVKMIGRLISVLDTKLNKRRKIEGFWMLGIVIVSVTSITFSLLFIAYKIHIILGLLIEAIVIVTTISQKGLKDAALDVYQPLIRKEITIARKKLAHIVGRDTNRLDKEEIARATIETVAENTTDGITAPLFWAFFAGGTGAMIYRAINTCDSMVGYQNKQYQNFGWASAKLDDLVNWLPARITGIIMLFITTDDISTIKKSIWKLRKEAGKHSSPNSGWTEASVALALGIELGGPNYYQGILSEANKIGEAKREIINEDIRKTIQLMQLTSLFFILIIILGAIIYELTQTWI